MVVLPEETDMTRLLPAVGRSTRSAWHRCTPVLAANLCIRLVLAFEQGMVVYSPVWSWLRARLVLACVFNYAPTTVR